LKNKFAKKIEKIPKVMKGVVVRIKINSRSRTMFCKRRINSGKTKNGSNQASSPVRTDPIKLLL
jgi:hypothetical protein